MITGDRRVSPTRRRDIRDRARMLWEEDTPPDASPMICDADNLSLSPPQSSPASPQREPQRELLMQVPDHTASRARQDRIKKLCEEGMLYLHRNEDDLIVGYSLSPGKKKPQKVLTPVPSVSPIKARIPRVNSVSSWISDHDEDPIVLHLRDRPPKRTRVPLQQLQQPRAHTQPHAAVSVVAQAEQPERMQPQVTAAQQFQPSKPTLMEKEVLIMQAAAPQPQLQGPHVPLNAQLLPQSQLRSQQSLSQTTTTTAPPPPPTTATPTSLRTIVIDAQSAISSTPPLLPSSYYDVINVSPIKTKLPVLNSWATSPINSSRESPLGLDGIEGDPVDWQDVPTEDPLNHKVDYLEQQLEDAKSRLHEEAEKSRELTRENESKYESLLKEVECHRETKEQLDSVACELEGQQKRWRDEKLVATQELEKVSNMLEEETSTRYMERARASSFVDALEKQQNQLRQEVENVKAEKIREQQRLQSQLQNLIELHTKRGTAHSDMLQKQVEDQLSFLQNLHTKEQQPISSPHQIYLQRMSPSPVRNERPADQASTPVHHHHKISPPRRFSSPKHVENCTKSFCSCHVGDQPLAMGVKLIPDRNERREKFMSRRTPAETKAAATELRERVERNRVRREQLPVTPTKWRDEERRPRGRATRGGQEESPTSVKIDLSDQVQGPTVPTYHSLYRQRQQQRKKSTASHDTPVTPTGYDIPGAGYLLKSPLPLPSDPSPPPSSASPSRSPSRSPSTPPPSSSSGLSVSAERARADRFRRALRPN